MLFISSATSDRSVYLFFPVGKKEERLLRENMTAERS
jgi:hypothetical protein